MKTPEDRTEEFANAAEGALVAIGRRHLAFSNDGVTFRDLPVVALRQALTAAFLAGVEYAATVRAEGGK